MHVLCFYYNPSYNRITLCSDETAIILLPRSSVYNSDCCLAPTFFLIWREQGNFQ
jgi:hypothetical protein